MPRLYIPDINTVTNQIIITGEKARYLISVIRCKKGDELSIFDGKGKCFRTKIVKASRKEVIAEVIEAFSSDTESPLNIILIQGLLKGEKMDFVIQRTTELGVKEIIPAITKRSQLRETKKINRWRKIAEESSRQSGRSVIPVIHEPLDLGGLFNACSSQKKPCAIIFYEVGGMRLSEAIQQSRIQDSGCRMRDTERNNFPQYHESCIMHREFSPMFIFIGPEGGFTGEEIALAKENGLMVVSFGKRILRAETAAISAVTLIQFLLGDLS
jgi:16S rRNA (uracil1498-N3)-methyltransferase